MNSTNKTAVPVKYLAAPTIPTIDKLRESRIDIRSAFSPCAITAEQKIGSVKVVASDGPPLSVRPWTPNDGDNKHIAIELDDMLKLAHQGLGYDTERLLRLCLHLKDARMLTCHLISTLAESGDSVAELLNQRMTEILGDPKAAIVPPQKAKLFVKHLIMPDNTLDTFKTQAPVMAYKLTWGDRQEPYGERLVYNKPITTPFRPTLQEQTEAIQTIKRILQKLNLVINHIEQVEYFGHSYCVDYKKALSDSLTPEVTLTGVPTPTVV